MTVYLNGQFMPIEEARVPVLDRGFIFGDGVYEVIPVYSRRAFRMAEHLKRLQHSLDGIKLPNPHSESEWTGILNELIKRNAPEDQYLYLHITRGVAKRDHPFPNPPVPPTVFAMSNPLVHPPAALLASGVCAVTAQDNRWLRCDIKAISLLPNVLLRQAAVDAGCAETVMIRDDAFLTEGALEVSGLRLEVWHTPGHSPGSICLYWADKKVLITGDLVFNGSVGRTDFPGGSITVLKDSERKVIPNPWGSSTSVYEPINARKLDRVMDGYIVTVGPEFPPEPLTHEGQELAFVLEGGGRSGGGRGGARCRGCVRSDEPRVRHGPR